jgi:hypothetical protein
MRAETLHPKPNQKIPLTVITVSTATIHTRSSCERREGIFDLVSIAYHGPRRGTTANRKKLFFNLRKAKSKISALEGHPGSRWTVMASPIAKMINAGNTIAKPIVFASIVTSLARIRHEG